MFFYNDLYREVMSYKEILRLAEAKNENETLQKYNIIKAHEGPLTKIKKSCNGSSYNVMIEWENGEVNSKPLLLIATDNLVTFTKYAIDNDMLHLDSWKRFRRITKNQKKFIRMVRQKNYDHTEIRPSICLDLRSQKIINMHFSQAGEIRIIDVPKPLRYKC